MTGWDQAYDIEGITCPNCGCIRTGTPTECATCGHDACDGCLHDGRCDLCIDIEKERRT